MCSENKSTLRTQVNYEEDITLNLSLTGIKEICIFNSTPSFHVINNLSVDIMHDIFEGILHYDLIIIQ